MRGRKPTPTALKLLHNNPGRRPLNAREPNPGALDPAPPAELADDPIACAEWARMLAGLTVGHVTTVDRATLAAYCRKYAQWKGLEAEADKYPYIVKSPSGYPMPNPAIGMANKALSLMLKAAVELGITPSSRSRILAGAGEESHGVVVDAFTAFQRKRRGAG